MKRFWTPSAAFLAQEVHAVIGFLAPTLALALGFPFWLGAVAILLVAAVKEGVVDFYLEGQGFMEGGWLDFSFYVIGAAVASVLFSVR